MAKRVYALDEAKVKIAELENTIKKFTDGVSHFHKSHGDMTPLLEVWVEALKESNQ